MKNKVQLFEEKQVRSVWDDEKEEWYFSVVDVVGVLSSSSEPKRYWSDLKRKLLKEGAVETYEKIVRLKMPSPDGKTRFTDAATLSQLLRLIQSIPSPKAEPFKQWLAKVGSERIDETIDPELAMERAKEAYIAKGYSPEWVTQRLQGIKTRNELTDEWRKRGIKESKDFAVLTAILHKETFDVTVKQHKAIKGMKKENLRDNMTTLETALTMLAEASATELERTQDPNTMTAHRNVAKAGGSIAKRARLDIEKQTGKKVVSSQNASDLIEETKAAATLPGKTKKIPN